MDLREKGGGGEDGEEKGGEGSGGKGSGEEGEESEGRREEAARNEKHLTLTLIILSRVCPRIIFLYRGQLLTAVTWRRES